MNEFDAKLADFEALLTKELRHPECKGVKLALDDSGLAEPEAEIMRRLRGAVEWCGELHGTECEACTQEYRENIGHALALVKDYRQGRLTNVAAFIRVMYMNGTNNHSFSVVVKPLSQGYQFVSARTVYAQAFAMELEKDDSRLPQSITCEGEEFVLYDSSKFVVFREELSEMGLATSDLPRLKPAVEAELMKRSAEARAGKNISPAFTDLQDAFKWLNDSK